MGFLRCDRDVPVRECQSSHSPAFAPLRVLDDRIALMKFPFGNANRLTITQNGVFLMVFPNGIMQRIAKFWKMGRSEPMDHR